MGPIGNPSCQAAAARWQLGPSHLKASINVSASWAGTIATAKAAEGGGHGSGISVAPQPLHMTGFAQNMAARLLTWQLTSLEQGRSCHSLRAWV